MIGKFQFPNGKYRTIYLDPPWPERGGGKIKRGADRHYSLMSVKEILSLPIGDLADPEGCHVYCWVTNNYLPMGLECLKAWGFEYITTITWMKDRQGLGQYYRGLTEHCLFGTTRKRLPYKLEDGKRCQGLTGFMEPKTIHSRKPARMREMIERVSYTPRIELFARESHPGWDIWGDKLQKGEELAWQETNTQGAATAADSGLIPDTGILKKSAIRNARNPSGASNA
ncbi:MAG: methyltransferase [Oscillospiraceae bacterium]|nr:methyltransferase [Oscillospiraceae bacterium]